MPDGEFNALYAAEKDAEKAEFLAAEQDNDLYRFFNEPHALADFDYWLRIDFWTAQEAVALSLGKAPEIVNRASLKKITATSPFKREFYRRHLAVRRLLEADTKPLTPSRFITWATALEIDLPNRMLELIPPHTPSPLDHDQVGNGSLFKLIITAAIARYDFDPSYSDGSRSSSFQRISDDAANLGITLDPKTIKRYLSEALDWAREKDMMAGIKSRHARRQARPKAI